MEELTAQEDDSALPADEGTRGIRGPDGEPQFFADPGMDRFVAVILNMASEMWVQEERLRAVEGARGGAAGPPDEPVTAFIHRVFAPLREPRRGG